MVFTPFLPYIALILVFCLTDSAAGILQWFLAFYLPHAGARDDRHCVRESAQSWGTQEIRSTLVMSGLKPRPPVRQASGLSIALFPLG